jgi:hypothetical protein
MKDIILYCEEREKETFKKFKFYDNDINDIIKNSNMSNMSNMSNISNIWIDYSSFCDNNSNKDTDLNKTLIRWILKKKYLITCLIRDIEEIEQMEETKENNKKYINLYRDYKDYKEIQNWDII